MVTSLGTLAAIPTFDTIITRETGQPPIFPTGTKETNVARNFFDFLSTAARRRDTSRLESRDAKRKPVFAILKSLLDSSRLEETSVRNPRVLESHRNESKRFPPFR